VTLEASGVRQWICSCKLALAPRALGIPMEKIAMSCNAGRRSALTYRTAATAGITATATERGPTNAMLAHHPAAWINSITFHLSGADHWALGSRRCYVNGFHTRRRLGAAVLRIGNVHPCVRSHVKTHNLGFEVSVSAPRGQPHQSARPRPVSGHGGCGEALAGDTLFT
jgi:hypothetical protein